MADPQGLVYWPGIQQFESATVNLAHGISPSTITISIAPQMSNVAMAGDLEFLCGNARAKLRDCKLDSGAVSYDQSGAIVSLAVLDRRWKWAFGSISGVYNRRLADGTIDFGDGDKQDDTERTPRQLAAMCLDAMGESGYDVSALPNESRPLVEWDSMVPAHALARLCDDLGCHVMIELRGQNRAKIVRLGRGSALPLGPVMSDSIEVNPAEMPDAVSVVAGYNRYQADFELEAVGVEKNGDVKLIDELSYKPANGWTEADLIDFSMISDKGLRELAKQNIFRTFRVKVPVVLPGFNAKDLPEFQDTKGIVHRLDQILPLGTEQVQQAFFGNTRRPKPAIVFGKYWKGDDGEDGNTVDQVTPYVDGDKQLVTRPWQIDRELGLVRFSDPIYAVDSERKIIPPVLRLRTSVALRDRLTRAFARFTKRQVRAGRKFTTRDKFVKHDEVALTHYPVYDNNFKVVRVEDNNDSVTKEVESYLKAALEEMVDQTPASRTYAGLMLHELDGAIQAMTFTVDSNGARTTLHRNHDPGSEVSLPYRERRELERTKAARDVKALFGPDAIARQGKVAGG